jgi:thiosulfate sulfurtransferase
MPSMRHLEQIDIHQAKKLIDQGHVTILDTRDLQSFEQAHIPQAKALLKQDKEQFVREIDKSQPLLCYCYKGIGSRKVAEYFSQNGFQTVYSMDGGFEEWRKSYPTT